jgi:hypothetical protein
MEGVRPGRSVVLQPRDTVMQKTRAPASSSARHDRKPVGNLQVLLAFAGQQHNPGAQHNPGLSTAPARIGL